MKQKIYEIAVVLLLWMVAVQSCDDPQEDHYEVERRIEAERPLDIIRSNPNFSEFATLLNTTGMESLLDNQGTYTVFAPVNGSIGDLSGFSEDELRAIVEFHISTAVLYSSDIGPIGQLKSVNGKQLFFNRAGAGTIQDASISDPDHVARFGVVHGIDRVLLPAPNLLEIIFESGDFDYIGDYLKENTDTVFDESLSTPIGFDSLGRTIYDSAFRFVNPILDDAGLQLASEDKSYTIFLLDDEFMDDYLGQLFNDFQIPDPDTAGLVDFAIEKMLEGSFKGSYLQGTLPAFLDNLNGDLIDVSALDLTYSSLGSNGVVYKESGIPVTPVEFRYDLTLDQPELANALPDNEAEIDISTFSKISSNNLTTLIYRSGLNGFGGRDSWLIQPFTQGDHITFDMDPVIPGTYEIDLRSWNRSSDVNIYFNDELIVENFPLNTTSLRVGIATITITEPLGNFIRVEALTTSRAFLDYFNFRPVN